MLAYMQLGLFLYVYGEAATVKNCEAILNMCMAQCQCGSVGACQHAAGGVFLCLYTAKSGVMGEKAVKKQVVCSALPLKPQRRESWA